jgi:hypothetical protein
MKVGEFLGWLSLSRKGLLSRANYNKNKEPIQIQLFTSNVGSVKYHFSTKGVTYKHITASVKHSFALGCNRLSRTIVKIQLYINKL